jgi:hypothetical protein
MLALDRIYAGSGPLRRLAPWIANLAPSEKLRHYVRMCGQPLETRYRGVSRGFTEEGKLRLVGADRMKQSERQLREVFGGYFQAVEKASPLDRMLYTWMPRCGCPTTS